MNELIKKYEGLRLKAYKCPAGLWTIGYGTTYYLNGDAVKEGDKITEEQAEEQLKGYVFKSIIEKLPKELLDNVTSNQLDAIVCLIYNIGLGAFLRSSLYKAILNNDYKQIAKNWDWFSGGGKVLKGLVKRRCEELNLFMQDI